jgi:hypothetical protein
MLRAGSRESARRAEHRRKRGCWRLKLSWGKRKERKERQRPQRKGQTRHFGDARFWFCLGRGIYLKKSPFESLYAR